MGNTIEQKVNTKTKTQKGKKETIRWITKQANKQKLLRLKNKTLKEHKKSELK